LEPPPQPYAFAPDATATPLNLPMLMLPLQHAVPDLRRGPLAARAQGGDAGDRHPR
jgi:hypothetical protein